MAVTTTTAAVLVAATAAISAGGAIASGVASKEQAEAQAKVEKQRANRERALAEQRERDFRRRQSALAARVRAIGGARGIDTSTGSSLLASTDFQREVELQANRIREGGEVSATRLEQQAGLLESAGRSALVSGGIQAGSSLFSGFGRSAQILRDAG